MMKSFAVFATLTGLLLLSACGTTEKPPYAGIKLGKPYEIYGRWYKPHYDKDYDEIGMASWYGPGFHGGHTANGERFDQNALTGAHRTLPMPSIVRVTNLDNGRSALVKINDRGPFAHDRIIDLSKAAAIKLGVFQTGTAKVRVQFLERETREYVQNLQGGTSYAMTNLKKVDPSDAGANEAQRQAQLDTANAAANAAAPAGAIETPLPAPATAALPWAATPSSVAAAQPPVAVPPVTHTAAAVSPSAPPAISSDIFTSAEYLEAEAADNEGALPPRAVTGASAPARQSADAASAGFMVQAGTFGLEGNAQHLRDRVVSAGHAQVVEVEINNRTFYRVMMGPYNMQSDAKYVLSKLSAMGIPDAKIIRN